MVRILSTTIGLAALLAGSSLAAPVPNPPSYAGYAPMESVPAPVEEVPMMNEVPPMMEEIPPMMEEVPPMMGDIIPTTSFMVEMPVETPMMGDVPPPMMEEEVEVPMMEEPPMMDDEDEMFEPPMEDEFEVPPPMQEVPSHSQPYIPSEYIPPPSKAYPSSIVEEIYSTVEAGMEAPMVTPTSTYTYNAVETSYPTYGSGSSDWGADYDDCVSKCVAKYEKPAFKEWTPKEPAKTQDPSAAPTHTVMVAPMEGVLKYMPFALNATVGDTVRFVWTGPGEHSVTTGSKLNLCGKSQTPGAFDTGVLSGKDGEVNFDIQVTGEETIYFHSSVDTQCAQGMWGMINPRASFGKKETVGGMMNEWVESNPDLQAAWNVVQEEVKGTLAETWGNSMNIEDIPAEQYVNMAENTIWTRANLGANPGMQEFQRGAATPDGSPLKIVGDLTTLLSANVDPAAAPVEGTNQPQTTAAPAPSTSGALRLVSSSVLVTAVAVLASVFMV